MSKKLSDIYETRYSIITGPYNKSDDPIHPHNVLISLRSLKYYTPNPHRSSKRVFYSGFGTKFLSTM
jgi:hypothetical protein